MNDDEIAPEERHGSKIWQLIVLDSGVGGMGYLQSFMGQLCKDTSSPERPSQVHITYVADTEFFPYSQKTAEQIRERMQDLLAKILPPSSSSAGEVTDKRPGDSGNGIDAVITACNTLTTQISFSEMAAQYPQVRHWAGVVPHVRRARELAGDHPAMILATELTARSSYLDEAIQGLPVTGGAWVREGSTDLVEIAEAAFFRRYGEGPAMMCDSLSIHKERFARRFTSILESTPDLAVVLLSCTHFVFYLSELEQLIQAYAGDRTRQNKKQKLAEDGEAERRPPKPMILCSSAEYAEEHLGCLLDQRHVDGAHGSENQPTQGQETGKEAGKEREIKVKVELISGYNSSSLMALKNFCLIELGCLEFTTQTLLKEQPS